jgi:hypothetical protein
MKKQFYFRMTAVIALITMLGVGLLNAQQTKRNLIANSNFEDGLKHWRWDGNADFVFYDVETDNPIAGTASAQIQMFDNAPDPWNLQLYSFFPVEEYAKYRISFKVRADDPGSKFKIEVCESFDNNSGFKPIDIDSWDEDFIIDNPDINDLRGTMTAGPEVKEYEFITKGNTLGFPSYIIAFHFGHADLTTFYIDDVIIKRIDDGDWDGNLFPVGNFESDREIVLNSQGYWIDGRTPNTESVAYLSDENPISGTKSFYIYKSATEADEPADAYWPLSYHFRFWTNDISKVNISFKGKSTKEGGLFPMRMICNPWGWGGGDVYAWEIPLTTTAQEYSPKEINAHNWFGKGEGKDYSSVVLPPFEWGDNGANTGFRGQMSLHGSLLGDPAGWYTAKDIGFWIDDVVVKEAGLYLEKFDVDYAPTSVGVDETAQFRIGEFVYPTNAPSQVEFWVENKTGEATIDQDGIITGVKEGTVDVYVDTPGMTDEQVFTVVVGSTGIEKLNMSVVRLSTNVVQAGEVIEIKAPYGVNYEVFALNGQKMNTGQHTNLIRTNLLGSGIYFVNLELDNGQKTARKFIVK